ncbi:MAG TPA: NlpC/P60 family protein [Solirubrobacterales bacterium]
MAAAASQAGRPYCWDGGGPSGPTHGSGGPGCEGSTVGFDCTGLTIYAVYQATGKVLSHDGHQGTEGGQRIYNESELQPGDLVFFGGTFENFDHAGVYAGGGKIWDALNYGIPVQEHTLAQVGLPFVGGARYWSGGASVGEGSFVQVAGHSEVFKIVGGAPLYVSNWSAVGGPKPVTAISQAQFDSLRPYPADGTLVNTTNDGRVYVIAGGAPLYVSNWSGIGGPKPSISIDGWDVANTANPAAHLRPYPADGTLVNTPNDGRVYEIAGGAPLYVSNWSAIGGARPSTTVDGWDVANALNPYAHLRPYPADGTFLNSSTGRVYRVAGGAPIPVSTWSVFGGIQPYVTVDQWDMDNEANPVAHLRSAPVDGTVVQGLPSHSFWVFGGSLRSPAPASSTAVAVDDAGLAGYPIAEAPSEGPQSERKTARRRASKKGGAKPAHRRRHRACRKHRDRRRVHCAKSGSQHRHPGRLERRHQRRSRRVGSAGRIRLSGSRG